MRKPKNIFSNIDWLLVILYLMLVLTGWINIYAAVYNSDHASIFDATQKYGKQLMWIATSIVLAIIILVTEAKFFSTFSYLIYGAMLLLLLGVLGFGKEIAGSKSWFQIGSFAIQPAEFAKFATSLAIAKLLSDQQRQMKFHRFKKIIPIIIFSLPALLILLQNDTGSALVYSSFLLVMYREGLSGHILVLGIIVAILFIFTLLFGKFTIMGILAGIALLFSYFMRKSKRALLTIAGILIVASGFIFSVDYAFENILEPHQRTRINVLLGVQNDPHGAGYNVNQSKIAIGSGGFWGKGFLQGTQTKYKFVPEQSTDFIFCTIGEEWGFLGSGLVIIMFLGLLTRIVFVAERQRSSFARIYGYGVACILFFHFSINIAMTIGLAPVIGIPLPFISYGGSSLWAFTTLLFIFIKQDSVRLEIL